MIVIDIIVLSFLSFFLHRSVKNEKHFAIVVDTCLIAIWLVLLLIDLGKQFTT
jgi:hypothetical protein